MNARIIKRTLAILTLTAVAATTGPALAADRDDECWRPCRDRKGWLVGGNAGWGGGSVQFDDLGRTFSEDADGNAGFFGALRGGYAFSNSFALTLELVGFGNGDDDQEWGVGASCVTVTWWPDGSGFFVRVGGGAGGGDIFLEETQKKVHFEEKGAALFGLGYEWQLGRRFALGVAVDAFGFELDGATGFDKDSAGIGALSVQFNWYL
jgi:hypothetical protein